MWYDTDSCLQDMKNSILYWIQKITDANKKPELCKWLDTGIFHRVHWGINPLSKTTSTLSCQAPPINRQTVQAPHDREKYFCWSIFFIIKYFKFYFIFYVKIAPPSLKKVTSFFPSNPPLKVQVLKAQSLSLKKKGGGGTLYILMFGLCIWVK